MILIINGEERRLDGLVASESTVADVLKTLAYEGDAFAVAINRNCVPRALQATTPVNERDAIEILSPMQGG